METVKLATANINLALVILAINTLALVRATPVVLVLPAAENTANVTANHHILGHQVLVNALVLINTLALVLVTPAVLVQPVGGSMLNAIVQIIILGMVVVVYFLVLLIISIAVWVLDTPEDQALRVEENILSVFVPQVMNGKIKLANRKY